MICAVLLCIVVSARVGFWLLSWFVLALKAGRCKWFVNRLARKRGWPRDKGE